MSKHKSTKNLRILVRAHLRLKPKIFLKYVFPAYKLNNSFVLWTGVRIKSNTDAFFTICVSHLSSHTHSWSDFSSMISSSHNAYGNNCELKIHAWYLCILLWVGKEINPPQKIDFDINFAAQCGHLTHANTTLHFSLRPLICTYILPYNFFLNIWMNR